MENKELCDMKVSEIEVLAQEALDNRNNTTPVSVPKKDATHPFTIGANYLIRTVTMTQTGRLVWVGDKELVLEDAAWIPDTGRFHVTLAEGKGNLKEVEPCNGPVIIGRGSIIDAFPWKGTLPQEVK